MNKTRITFLFCTTIGLTLWACTPKDDIQKGDPIPVENVEAVAQMNQVLGWKLFNKEVAAKPDENILISPLSIQTAVNMALNGAKGNTLDEFLELLNCKGCSVLDINQRHRDLMTLLSSQSGHAKLTLANRFFYDSNRMSPKSPFLEQINTYYSAGNENVNFSNVQPALNTINGWVKANTNQKIDKILNNITAQDVAFLINALHFKADWAKAFSAEITQLAPFQKADGTQVQVPMMSADRDFVVSQTADFTLVDIPLRDSIFSVSLAMPTAASGTPNWQRNITPDLWKSMYANTFYGRAMVFVPKLKMSYENDLIQSLKALGVQAPFDETTADFTLLGTATRNIFINQIKHKAVFEMDEKGVEGAAVTSIGFGVTSLPPMIQFNRPFVLVLRHIPTNALVFTAYVADPLK